MTDLTDTQQEAIEHAHHAGHAAESGDPLIIQVTLSIATNTVAANCSGPFTSTLNCVAPSSTTGNSTGTMTLVAGTPTGYGWEAGEPVTGTNQVAETGTVATSSYLDEPMGITFDAAGNLYIPDEYKEGVLVLNTNTTGSTTVAGISFRSRSVSPRSISKVRRSR